MLSNPLQIESLVGLIYTIRKNNRLNVVFIYYSSSYKIPGETTSVQQGYPLPPPGKQK